MRWLTATNRWGLREIQSASIAGGVAIGSVCSGLLPPWGAVIMGFAAGVSATVGIEFLSIWVLQVRLLHLDISSLVDRVLRSTILLPSAPTFMTH